MLTFNLKKEWFEKIKSGEKIYEYRIMTDYWNKRLYPIEGCKPGIKTGEVVCFDYKGNLHFKNQNKLICFACGYPRKDDNSKRLYAKITKVFTNVDGRDTDLKIDKPVYAIEFELLEVQGE